MSIVSASSAARRLDSVNAQLEAGTLRLAEFDLCVQTHPCTDNTALKSQNQPFPILSVC